MLDYCPMPSNFHQLRAKLAPVSWPSVQKSPAAPAPVEIASQQFLYV